MNWLAFFLGFFSWTADAFDFHALSIQQVKIAKYYDTTKTIISTAITLTLLLRSVGSIIFGMIGDKFGRKWPLVVNMIVLGLLQIGTIYARNIGEFIGVRALFGLFMGGGKSVPVALRAWAAFIWLLDFIHNHQCADVYRQCTAMQSPSPSRTVPSKPVVSSLDFFRKDMELV